MRNKRYIAGPMKDIEDHNFPAFDACAEYLRSHLRYVVHSPAEETRKKFGGRTPTDAEITPAAYADLLRSDFLALLQCDGIVLLPGWEKSNGARIEAFIALNAGLLLDKYNPAGTYGHRLSCVTRTDVIRALLVALIDHLAALRVTRDVDPIDGRTTSHEPK